MERIIRNEDFLQKLAKSHKRQGIKLLRQATEDEYKSVIEIILNADSFLNRSEIKKCRSFSFYTKFKKLGKVTKKQLIKLFIKWFEQLVVLLGFTIYRIFERGLCAAYIG